VSGNPASASAVGRWDAELRAFELAGAATLPHIGRGDRFVGDVALHPAARGGAATAHSRASLWKSCDLTASYYLLII
jgi:hypothetical protein